jgi:transposase-like protein
MSRSLTYSSLMRWGSLTTQVCPKCGLIDRHVPRPAHKQWRCNGCRHDFSLKSGSLFEGTRLPYHKLIKAMWIWSNTSKGLSAVAMARVVGICYQASLLLQHKFRWAFFSRALSFRFTGEVELDVVWVFKHRRKLNFRSTKALKKFNQKRRRRYAIAVMRAKPGTSRKEARDLAAGEINLTDKYQVDESKARPLLSIIERGPDRKIQRSIGFLLRKEVFAEVEPIVSRFVERGSKLFTDQGNAYPLLGAKYDLSQVNHSYCYSHGDGRHTNNVESGFSRFRRMEWGVYHRMSPQRVEWFFAETAWREEHRRTHPAQRLLSFMQAMMQAPACRELRNYGTSQPDRKSAPRRVKLEAMKAPSLKGMDRLCGMGLLSEALIAEVQAARASL